MNAPTSMCVLTVITVFSFHTSVAQETAQPSESTSSAKEHLPPDPPQHVMGDMSPQSMKDMMQMDDTRRFGKVMIDQLEWRANTDALAWDAQAWYGGDYNKLWFKTEGERTRNVTQDASAEILWDRNIARWWSLQAGVRNDFGVGPSHTWAAIGIQGIAPYWFDTEATIYISDAGRAAVRLKSDYDILITQRWILQPKAELNAYTKEDSQRNIGSGISDLDFGLRLRYEIRREIAPYFGVTWTERFGSSAKLARAAGAASDDLNFIAGIRFRF